MEELITTVILVTFGFALDFNNTLTQQSQASAYYEVEKSDNLAAVKPSPHHLHSLDGIHNWKNSL
jgi:hypothetical protein